MYGGSKTVGGAVADADGILLCLELGNAAHGAEDLLLHNLHVLSHVREDGRLDEEALVALAFTAGDHLGAGLLAGINVAVRCQVSKARWRMDRLEITS